jgi:hypothetical protein
MPEHKQAQVHVLKSTIFALFGRFPAKKTGVSPPKKYFF